VACLRQAFGQGISAEACATFARARRAKVPWDVLTRAVAQGVFAHAGAPAEPARARAPRSPDVWRLGCLAIGVYVVLRPFVGLGHELSVCGVAGLLHAAIGTGFWQPVIGWLGLDPIYAGGAVRAAGGVQIAGLAVAGPLGTWLHGLVPWLVLGPDRVIPDAGVSMVAAPGAPALGRGLASFGADVLWLTLGLWLARRSDRDVTLGLLGLFIQAQIVVNHLLAARLAIPDVEASGLPFALALALPNNGAWFTTALAQLPQPLSAFIFGGSLSVGAYACAALVLASGSRLSRLVRRRRRDRPAAAPTRQRRLLLAGGGVAVLLAVSPIGALAIGGSNWAGDPRPTLTGAPQPQPEAAELSLPNRPAVGPVSVRLAHGTDGAWRYLVDGQPRIIRGVGYNPQYAGLTAGDRARLYQRDFSAMRGLGINTIEGWFETQFDELTLDYAARNGIGVLMPFELNQDWPYDNPNVRQSILDHVSAYVERYKNNPAVRMWAPGNEDLHRILYPQWVSQENNPVARARADAFAAFLPVLVDRIHQLDPDHPVIYRDAEDVYLARLKTAFLATGVERPWLVYGANVYSQTRLEQIVATWPSQWLGGPLVLSEFAPAGVGPAERPLGFERDWAIIRSRPGVVLGGLAYTWATNGPEELDRVFGLVDPQGIPSDGALMALSSSYLADLAQTAHSGPPS